MCEIISFCRLKQHKTHGNKLILFETAMTNNEVRWPGGNLSTHSVGGTSPTKTPSKLHSTVRINPYKWTFPNCDISCIMDQSTNKTTNESDFTSGKNCAIYILGAMLIAWQQTIAWVIRKSGTLLADVVCFEVQGLKSLLNLLFTQSSKVMTRYMSLIFSKKTFTQSKNKIFKMDKLPPT